MKLLITVALSAIILSSCNNSKSRTVSIWIENNSDSDTTIKFATYIDDSLHDVREVHTDSVADRIHTFKATFDFTASDKGVKIKVINLNSKETTECLIAKDSIPRIAFVHVNYAKKIYKKGRIIGSEILDRDSVFERQFYCEPVYRNSK